MTPYDYTLEGVFEHKLDPKSRVAVPSDWRVLTGSGVLRLLSCKGYGLPILRVLTEQEFATMQDDIQNNTEWSPRQKRAFRGKLFSSCQRTMLNSQGKLLIPKALCSHPGLEAEGQVTLIGRGTYFEIISPKNYEEMCVLEDAEIAKLNVDMDIF